MMVLASKFGGRRAASGSFRGAGSGFSLIELIVVVTIMAVLAALIVPAVSGISARQARQGVDQVEDILTMYAYRDSVGVQPVALWGSAETGQLELQVLDIDPDYPDEPAIWVPDRFSTPLTLPTQISIVDVRLDGRRLYSGEFLIARQPSQPRPTIEIDLEGEDVATTIVLDPQGLTPRRLEADRPTPGYRVQVDLDRQGRDREDW